MAAIGAAEQENRVAQLAEITTLTQDAARQLLSATSWSVEDAIDVHFSGGFEAVPGLGGGGGGYAGGGAQTLSDGRDTPVVAGGPSPAGEVIKCDHRDRGYPGTLEKAYVGPKSAMPRHLQDGGRTCSGPGRSSSSSGASCSAAAPSDPACCAAQYPEDLQLEECPICTEDINFSDAAMRCTGCGGKRHYFHSQCLTGWIRQCNDDGRAPDCPSCRGPLQVHKRRLGEFLQNNTGLDQNDRSVLEGFCDCEGEEDADAGWFSIDKQTVIKGAMIAGAVIAVGAVAHTLLKAFANRRKDEDRDRR